MQKATALNVENVNQVIFKKLFSLFSFSAVIAFDFLPILHGVTFSLVNAVKGRIRNIYLLGHETDGSFLDISIQLFKDVVSHGR
jgi:hypothetical protein